MCPFAYRTTSTISFFIFFLLFFPLSGNSVSAPDLERQPLRLLYRGASGNGQQCDLHGQSTSRTTKKETSRQGGRPRSVFESEHRPAVQRTYFFTEHRRRADVEAFIRRPDGTVIKPAMQLGATPNVSFATPFGDGPVHGPNSVYVVEKGGDNSVLTIRTAKWITMHHNCGWGHDGKFDKNLTKPQALQTIPFEIVVDKLWNTNFHLAVSSGDKLTVTVLSYGTPLPGAAVTLSTEKGWSKRMVTDKDGRAVFQLIRDYYPSLWREFKRDHRGEFLLTASYIDEQQSTYKGKSYQRTRYITTLPWLYTPSLRDYASYSHGLILVLLAMTICGFGVYIFRKQRKKPYKGIQFDE